MDFTQKPFISIFENAPQRSFTSAETVVDCKISNLESIQKYCWLISLNKNINEDLILGNHLGLDLVSNMIAYVKVKKLNQR